MNPSSMTRLEKMHNLGRRRFLMVFILLWCLASGMGNVLVFHNAYITDLIGTTVMNVLFNALLGYFFLGPFAWGQIERLYKQQHVGQPTQAEDDIRKE